MSKPSEYGNLRFCPKCGVDGLGRDYYPDGPPEIAVSKRSPKVGCEYICKLCGFGFLIEKSRRVNMSDALHREHRQQRAAVSFTEKCIGSDVAAAFLESRRNVPRGTNASIVKFENNTNK